MVRLCNDAKYTVEIFHPDFGFKVKKIRKRAHTDETETQNNEIEIQSTESVANYRCASADENMVISKFLMSVSEGPDYVCSSCTKTFFKHSVRNAKTLSDDIKHQYLSNIISVNGCEWVCVSCWKVIKKEKTQVLVT
jgi:DNA-directed RNA polymerase subunit RPC12/RpoP